MTLDLRRRGERFVSVFTKMELDKLSVMYDGDKDRDATSKIRGFLFQDYVTIMCLLKNQVEYVCSEYLEDVDVFFREWYICVYSSEVLSEHKSEYERDFDRSLLSVSPSSDAS